MSALKTLIGDDVITQAMAVHREMVQRADRGSIPNAMREIEADYGLNYWAQWAAWYRRDMKEPFARKVHAAWIKMLIASVERDMETIKAIERGAHAAPNMGDLAAQAGNMVAQGTKLVARAQAEARRRG